MHHISRGLWFALSIPIAVSAFALSARAVTSDLTSGTTGSLLLDQSFHDVTRAADVGVLGSDGRTVLSMTVAGVDILGITPVLVGARIYDSSTGVAIASADVLVFPGDNQTITIPIYATLGAGATYRLAFFAPNTPAGNNGNLFDPDPSGAGGFGYVESQGLFQVNGGFQITGDSFPTFSSSTIPRISLETGTAGSGDLFVTNFHSAPPLSTVDVVGVDPDTGAQTSVTSDLGFPTGIAREAGGQLLVADSFHIPQGAVIRVNPLTGAGSVVSQGGFINFGGSGTLMLDLEVGPGGEIYVVERDPALLVDQLIRIDPVSGAQALVPVNPSLGALLAGIGVEADGSLIVAYQGTSFSLVRIDPDTGSQQVVSQWIREVNESILDVEVEPSGTILFCAEQVEEGPPLVKDSSLVRVDPATWSQTVLSTGGLLNGCVGIAVDASGEIWVSAGGNDEVSGNEAIVEVDPVTGAQTLVTSGGIFDTAAFLVADGAVACADGADNDGDGSVDAADPGCLSPVDGSEFSAIQCDDGIDNDGDGFTDFDPDPGEGDPQCVGPTGNRERPNKSCGLGFELAPALLALAWASRRMSHSGKPTLRMRSGPPGGAARLLKTPRSEERR